ncbi:MAG TPA: alpha/beta hydrolase-fold protein [Chitinophagaceae bacterium]|nr:alpha/beta hydrolase-fold protein [Chitinophagaceae bacterium]
MKNILVEQHIINSAFLEREVTIDAYLPVDVPHPENMGLLLINDGQDLPRMPFDEILDDLITGNIIEPIVCIGIYCGPDRKMEYGTAKEADYKGRGARAGLYTQFVFEELLPFIHQTYNVETFKSTSFAGFSLGGLSALDIVWNSPQLFSKVGVFSGSLWWRSRDYDDGYDENTDRIMHCQVREGNYYPQLSFFFECGALDETEDRNKNGIIDSIDDTLDLIKELKILGYPDDSIRYMELEDGKHDVPTWARAFPVFLQWGWPVKAGL